MSDALALKIAAAIDDWRGTHPEVSVMEVLKALEEVRHTLTEAFLKTDRAK